jgi:8-oxo-dGTP pyrophosphatase MutT (NUDIX family)
MIEADDRLKRLSSVLFPLATPLAELPVDGFKPDSAIWRPRPAAVLVSIIIDPEPALILTVRSDALKSHAGQVAFPGGGREGTELFPLQTALREAQEEVGIDPGQVEVIGLMRCFDTITAYRIVPVVGLIHGPWQATACPREVREVFRLPLTEVLEPTAYRQHQVRRQRRKYVLWSMRSACWPIWGATAAILSHLAELAAGSVPALHHSESA